MRKDDAVSKDVSPSHLLKRLPFNPEQFLGKGWKIDEQVGRRTGDNLDAGRIVGKDYLRRWEYNISGEQCLRRIKAKSDVQLDADDFLALWQENGHVTLKWLYGTKGITFLSFWGTILRYPFGDRFVLCLDRFGNGSWNCDYYWVDCGSWGTSRPSSVLA
ncbi:MAG: hypothetical protein WCW66_02070 [Patescibacteria group bacterium]